MTVRQAHPSQSWSGTTALWTGLNSTTCSQQCCALVYVSLYTYARLYGCTQEAVQSVCLCVRIYLIPWSLTLPLGGERPHWPENWCWNIARFAAYRTTVSIRMSRLLICTQLAVNCVGERGVEKERERFLDLLPFPPTRWLRTGAEFSPVRQYNRHLLLSSATAALCIQFCFKRSSNLWWLYMRVWWAHNEVVGCTPVWLALAEAISLKA